MTVIEALMSVVQLGDSKERTRGNKEAATEDTMRIVRLGLGWALWRVGAAQEADRSAVPAIAVLMGGDAVERCVARLFEERVREARLGGAAARWPELFSRELDRVEDPFDRYKVELLISNSLVLSPWIAVDAPNRYWHYHRGDPLTPPSDRSQTSFASKTELMAAFDGHQLIPDPVFWRSALCAAAPLGLDAVMSAHDRLRAVWPGVRDPLSANSHFSVRVAGYIDALVFAIAETVHPLVPA